jgi:putative ABC transport system permease protein
MNMSFLQLAFRGLRYHLRINVTVAVSVAAATAVLTGALLVGDSVRGSLRRLTLDSLGRVDEFLLTDRYFSGELAEKLVNTDAFQSQYSLVAGALIFPQGTIERQAEDAVNRAANVLVVGCQDNPSDQVGSFWDLANPADRPARLPEPGEVILNQPLANELGAKVGDRVTVRLPMPEGIPADSPMGEKEDRIRGLPRLKVIEIVPGHGLGGFRLSPSQSEPRNAFLALSQLQAAIDEPGQINAMLVSGKDPDQLPDAWANAALTAALRPSLDDLGLAIDRPRLTFPSNVAVSNVVPSSDDNGQNNDASSTAPEAEREVEPSNQSAEVIYDYFRLTSNRMVLEPEVEAAANTTYAAAGGQPVFTYLANRMRPVEPSDSSSDASIPYSMISAIDISPHFTLHDIDGEPIKELLDDQIVLTSWAAEDLGVNRNNKIQLTYFEPETTHGDSEERTVELTVQAITPLTTPAQPYMPDRKMVFDQRPTIANDPFMTPEVEGLTDQRTIDDWDVPFQIDFSRILPPDDVYWADFGTTPKAYVSLATGRRLWSSRFGQATSYRIPAAPGLDATTIGQRVLSDLFANGNRLGFEFRRIKHQQLAASSGNTPFDVLFLLLSFFIIASALILVAILFRLGFQQRAEQAGLLLAVGWPERRVRRLFLVEGTCVAAIGGLLGVGIGVGYAWLILAALTSDSWWLGAIRTPFLEFHYTWRSLLIGYLAGVLICLATIAWSVYQTRRIAVRQLLAGLLQPSFGAGRTPSWIARFAAGILFLAAIGLGFLATSLGGQAQAGAFVGAGAAVLTGLLLETWNYLQSRGRGNATITGYLPLTRLAARSAARNPVRSTLTIGLISSASFLIVAMSAFQLRPSDTGTGGFDLVAESSQPVFVDFTRAASREDLLGDQATMLQAGRVFPFRVRRGDDASCGNLYQATQPSVLGVPTDFISYFDNPEVTQFPWAASAADSAEEKRNPWHLLDDAPQAATKSDDSPMNSKKDAPIPVVIDKETAMYSLHLYGGIGEEFVFTYDGQPIRFRVVGLLSLSILHGKLLVGDADFRRRFPTVSGHRYFLIKTPGERPERVAHLLEDALGDQGFDASDSRQVLSGLLAIQNTYLRTFQSLGGLGLLLGTFGLGAVQFRSVLERRREFALFRATGFRTARLLRMVVLESLLLLAAGLGSGVLAAAFAVGPHYLFGGTSIPVFELGAMLLTILLVGLLTGLIAASAISRAPVLQALREER